MSILGLAEFKVGALVLVVGGIIAFMSMQVSDDPSFFSRSQKAWFLMPNAGGLIKNSAVKSAGIPVGVIKDITLQDGQARVDITVKADVPLYTSASIEIRAQGILGDSHIEINPGSPTDPPLGNNAQILNVKGRGSLDNLIGSVGEVTASLKEVANNLREALSQDGTQKHILGRIVRNVEQLTSDIAEMTSQNKGKIGEIVDQVHDVTKELKAVLNDPGEKGFRATWQRASNAVKNLEEVTEKINNGDGVIGKLINDETTAENLDSAIEGVTNMVDAGSRLQTGFDFHAEYLSEVKATKSTVGITIQPGLDRFYYLGFISDPSGLVRSSRTRVVDTGTGATVTDVTEERTFKNEFKLTAYLAKNFWDLTVRAGLIENTGGVGVDYHFFSRKLKLSLEAFDFGNMNLRPSFTYSFYKGFYLSGGVEDSLDKSSRRSSYLGAGLYLTNDDLKFLLTKAPF